MNGTGLMKDEIAEEVGRKSMKHSPGMPARIFSYKAWRAVEGRERIAAQLLLARQYKNELIALERDRRVKIDLVMGEHYPDLPELKAAAEAIDIERSNCESEMKANNSLERKRRVTGPEKLVLAEIKARRSNAWVAYKTRKQELFANKQVQAILDKVDADDLVSQKSIRKKFSKDLGLYWGTYLLIEDTLKDKRKGSPPEFKKWNGDGAIGVLISGGITWEEATSGRHTMLYIEVLPIGPNADPNSNRSLNKRRAIASLRVGSMPGTNKPIWVKIPFHLHRPIPDGALIKSVRLHRRFMGPKDTYELQFVLTQQTWVRDDVAVDGTAGLDVGWRIVPDGLRVAYLSGNDGYEQEFVIPAPWLDIWSKIDSLKSIRQREFNEARDTLVGWLAANPELPLIVSDTLTYINLWKGTGRLRKTVQVWEENRFEGDDVIFPVMRKWLAQDLHLHEWEAMQSRKIIRRRNDLFRKFAAAIRRGYASVIVEDCNWRKVQERPDVTDNEAKEFTRKNARIAAVGIFLGFLKESVSKFKEVPAEYTTLKCNACDHIDSFDTSKNLNHTCSQCSAQWDQDQNAARNLRDYDRLIN